MTYDSDPLRRYCAERGMAFDEDAWARATKVFAQVRMTQEQADAVGKIHAETVQRYFTASFWPWRARVCLALFFLTGWMPKAKG